MRRPSDQWLRAVLRMLYRNPTTTRSEILEATGLNPSSASQALQFLLDHGVILRMGALQSLGGRPRDILKFNAEIASFVAVDLEGTRARFALTNVVGDIRLRWAEDLESQQELRPEQVVNGIQRVLRDLAPAERAQVIAVGISHPGIMNSEGRITAVNVGWDNIPLLSRLQESVDLPIFLERAGPNCILAERAFGLAKNSQNCVYLILGNGIGVGICADGRVLRGNNRMAGELGHMTVDPSADDRCNCGKTGCLEAIASSPNIVRQYLARKGGIVPQEGKCRVTDVFDRARQGDVDALAVLDRVITGLGLALSGMASLLNPEIIILGGDIVFAEDLILPRLKERVAAYSYPGTLKDLRLELSSLGLDVGLKGAASVAFEQALQSRTLLKKISAPTIPGLQVRQRAASAVGRVVPV